MQITLELGKTWDMFSQEDPIELLIDLLDERLADTGITDLKIIE
jgi:hypothetical protein